MKLSYACFLTLLLASTYSLKIVNHGFKRVQQRAVQKLLSSKNDDNNIWQKLQFWKSSDKVNKASSNLNNKDKEIDSVEEKIKLLSIDPSPFLKQEISWTYLILGTFLGSILSFITLVSTNPNLQATSTTSVISEQVTIFEDILNDLSSYYIEKIDPKKLFETAMGAMLSSLDPYTAYENIGDAKSFQESVSGKYGGVGLIISQTTDKKSLSNMNIAPKNTNNNINKEPVTIPIPATPTTTTPFSTSDTPITSIQNSKTTTTSTISPTTSTTPPTTSITSPTTSITVVDSFEGYAYDAGVRIGDRIISVAGVDTRGKAINEVCYIYM